MKNREIPFKFIFKLLALVLVLAAGLSLLSAFISNKQAAIKLEALREELGITPETYLTINIETGAIRDGTNESKDITEATRSGTVESKNNANGSTVAPDPESVLLKYIAVVNLAPTDEDTLPAINLLFALADGQKKLSDVTDGEIAGLRELVERHREFIQKYLELEKVCMYPLDLEKLYSLTNKPRYSDLNRDGTPYDPEAWRKGLIAEVAVSRGIYNGASLTAASALLAAIDGDLRKAEATCVSLLNIGFDMNVNDSQMRVWSKDIQDRGVGALSVIAAVSELPEQDALSLYAALDRRDFEKEARDRVDSLFEFGLRGIAATRDPRLKYESKEPTTGERVFGSIYKNFIGDRDEMHLLECVKSYAAVNEGQSSMLQFMKEMEVIGKSFAQRHSRHNVIGFFSQLKHPYASMFAWSCSESFASINDSARQVQLAKYSIALSWYKHEHGAYPDTLDQLVPRYLPELPINAWTSKPVEYRREGERYVLSTEDGS